MKKNVGGIDRTLRIVLGLVPIALAATGPAGWRGCAAVLLPPTGLVRSCPTHPLPGCNTPSTT